MSEKRSVRTVDALAIVDASFVVRTTLCCAVEGVEVIDQTGTFNGLLFVFCNFSFGSVNLR